MPICKLCNTEFPNKIKVDGVWKCLHRRKYCLECSPIGFHNSRPLLTKAELRDSFICSVCNKKVIEKEPRISSVSICSSCKVRNTQRKNKQKAVEYGGGKCAVCGYSKFIGALEFHHLDPSNKSFTIGGSHRSWKNLKEEIDKCILLCSNCHKEVEGGIIKLRVPPVTPITIGDLL